jgi:hypothetical protein
MFERNSVARKLFHIFLAYLDFKEIIGRVWTGFVWLRIQSYDGHV